MLIDPMKTMESFASTVIKTYSKRGYGSKKDKIGVDNLLHSIDEMIEINWWRLPEFKNTRPVIWPGDNIRLGMTYGKLYLVLEPEGDGSKRLIVFTKELVIEVYSTGVINAGPIGIYNSRCYMELTNILTEFFSKQRENVQVDSFVLYSQSTDDPYQFDRFLVPINGVKAYYYQTDRKPSYHGSKPFDVITWDNQTRCISRGNEIFNINGQLYVRLQSLTENSKTLTDLEPIQTDDLRKSLSSLIKEPYNWDAQLPPNFISDDNPCK